VPAGLAIAFLGTALALLNFGIDEFVNPRLRGSGGHKIKTAMGTARMRVGFTPVVRPEPTEVPAPPVGASTVTFGAKDLGSTGFGSQPLGAKDGAR